MTRNLFRAIAMGTALVGLAAACSSSSKSTATTTTVAASPTTVAPTSASSAASPPPSASASPATTGSTATAATTAPTVTTTDAPKIDDTKYGDGAAAWNAAVAAPSAADTTKTPVVITMSNLEGSPVGSFPEVREGLQAAVKEINEKLGGIGGRPIDLKTCIHGLDAAEATNCANQLLADKPVIHVNGVEFESPVVYPVLLANKIPILNAVPIFVADTNTAGVYSANPGCLEFVGDVRQMIATGHDRIAAVSALPLGPICANDITKRALDVLTKGTGVTYQIFEQKAGDPSDDPAMIQSISQFFTGAKSPGIFMPESAADCNTDLNDLVQAVVKADVLLANSCTDQSVLDNPNSVGATIAIVDYTTDLATKDPFLQLQLTTRDAALKALPITASTGGFMNGGYRDGILIWTVLDQMVAKGANIDDPVAVNTALAAIANTFALGSPPIDCVDAGKEYISVCLNETTYGQWTGTKFTYPAPNNGDFKSYSDVLASMQSNEPRPAS